MAYLWDKNLETGYKLVDDQHRELINAVNALNEANYAGQGSHELLEIVLFLIRYANRHFREEEALQRRFHYPEYSRHKTYHDDFKAQVNGLSKKMMGEGATPELVNEVAVFIGEWLINHIKGDDFAMAAFIQGGQYTDS
ncbi:hemerythrin [Clostridia bacterium]|nr:hemerythrin [Clostridia bacterium]